jgi:hypothetical protein
MRQGMTITVERFHTAKVVERFPVEGSRYFSVSANDCPPWKKWTALRDLFKKLLKTGSMRQPDL